ncbi:MAG: ABC transporter permease [Clostridia bacterium]|nr:ABC transporter permease [Clostridia bacterium]
MTKTFTLSKRNLKEIVRDPLSLIFLLALPLFMELLFYFIFHSLTSQFEMKNLAPGIAAFSQAFITLFTGLLISVDRSTSFLTRLFVSGAKPHEFIFGYALTMLPITLFQSVLFFAVGGIIDPDLFGWRMLLCIAASLLTALPFIGLGILFGSVFPEKSIGGMASVIITAQSLLSGMWFPIDKLSGAVLAAMDWLPFKNAADLLKNILNGASDPVGDILRPLLIVLAYAAAALVAAVLVFKKKMRSL